MSAATCSPTRHVWHVHSDGGLLITKNLAHGHTCACGRFVIAQVECSVGCRHKRVVSKSEFETLMREAE